jgi:hypothetical protein
MQRIPGQWSEYLRLLGLGLAIIMCVGVMGHFLKHQQRTSGQESQYPRSSPESATTPTHETQDPRTSLESAPTPAQVPPRGRDAAAREALIRGWLYLARQQYDPKTHDQVLSGLLAAYKTRGLSAESNSSLMATTQQVNEIGVAHTIDEANNLPPADAMQHLKTFTRLGPQIRLTRGQKTRLKLAVARALHRQSAR